MSTLEELGRDAQTDQTEAAQRSVARVQATYYQSLIDGGVPAELAGLLLQQMAWLLWHKGNYPDQPPMVMPGG